jgi:hypothetical protein
MSASNADALLRVWEQNVSAHPIRRALAVLDSAWPEVGVERWADAPIGQRDACLLNLYETLFGESLQTTIRCTGCGERLEATFAVRDILVGVPTLPEGSGSLELQEQEYHVEYCLPTSAHLLEVIARPVDAVSAAAALMQRCVIDARHSDTCVDPHDLPADVVNRLATHMAQRDPQADVRIDLECPECRQAVHACFDIVSYFWEELEDWAQRILVDVHTLASRYAWSEHDILAMSPTRRQVYLDLVRA